MTKDFDLNSYDYDLPVELIAKRPTQRRENCRLLVFNEERDEITHHHFYELDEILSKRDLLVLNDSKVIPCRVVALKKTGGKAEVFFLDIKENEDQLYPCLIRSNGKKRIGDTFYFSDNSSIEIVENCNDYFLVRFTENLSEFLKQNGSMPIPPYIRGGKADEQDNTDYQNVYAQSPGSVAAPTAGLHFDQNLLEKFNKAYVTLHVGMGTFKPVQSENILDHQMHSESFLVDESEAKKILNHKGNIIGVGTTSLRVLESCYSNDEFTFLKKLSSTKIFLHPGIDVGSIQGLITNFHLPKSSLIMLVSSLIGREKTMKIYKEAVKEKYRFYSYGDAMLILRKSYV